MANKWNKRKKKHEPIEIRMQVVVSYVGGDPSKVRLWVDSTLLPLVKRALGSSGARSVRFEDVEVENV